MDTSLQLHLWRRKVVFVKVFQMDFLTRESVTSFKDEANAMRRLRHENIVRFMGVVIDPPRMCIVMEYCSRGDLFTTLARLRKSYERKASEQREESFSMMGSPSLQQGGGRGGGGGGIFPKLQRVPSAVYYRSLEDEEAGENDGSRMDIGGGGYRDSTMSNATGMGGGGAVEAKFSPLQIIKMVAKGMKYVALAP